MCKICNTRQLFRLIKQTGIKKSVVNQSRKKTTLISSQPRRLERQAEHFKELFSQPSANLQLPPIFKQPEWNIEIASPDCN